MNHPKLLCRLAFSQLLDSGRLPLLCCELSHPVRVPSCRTWESWCDSSIISLVWRCPISHLENWSEMNVMLGSQMEEQLFLTMGRATTAGLPLLIIDFSIGLICEMTQVFAGAVVPCALEGTTLVPNNQRGSTIQPFPTHPTNLSQNVKPNSRTTIRNVWIQVSRNLVVTIFLKRSRNL